MKIVFILPVVNRPVVCPDIFPNPKASILLLSPVYESGDTLFKEFPKQTTFGDLDPVIERTDSKLSTDFSTIVFNPKFETNDRYASLGQLHVECKPLG